MFLTNSSSNNTMTALFAYVQARHLVTEYELQAEWLDLQTDTRWNEAAEFLNIPHLVSEEDFAEIIKGTLTTSEWHDKHYTQPRESKTVAYVPDEWVGDTLDRFDDLMTTFCKDALNKTDTTVVDVFARNGRETPLDQNLRESSKVNNIYPFIKVTDSPSTGNRKHLQTTVGITKTRMPFYGAEYIETPDGPQLLNTHMGMSAPRISSAKPTPKDLKGTVTPRTWAVTDSIIEYLHIFKKLPSEELTAEVNSKCYAMMIPSLKHHLWVNDTVNVEFARRLRTEGFEVNMVNYSRELSVLVHPVGPLVWKV